MRTLPLLDGATHCGEEASQVPGTGQGCRGLPVVVSQGEVKT